ncbi:MAG: hypothetical protein QXO75_09905, partial [Nitrososphaerota archaeon]
MKIGDMLIVVDPVDDRHSVQYELVSSLSIHLSKYYDVHVFSTYFSKERAKQLESAGVKVMSGKNVFLLNKLLKIIGKKNESNLWIESWFREAYFRRNSNEARGITNFNKVINISNTIPIKCDIVWLQGRSLYFTLDDMSKNNKLIRFILFFIRGS